MRTLEEWLEANPYYKPVMHEQMENVHRKQYDAVNKWAQECMDEKMAEIDAIVAQRMPVKHEDNRQSPYSKAKGETE